MNILIVNDDGYKAEGIVQLAQMACSLGKVWVVAPKGQCSAMSHRLTLRQDIPTEEVPFPVAGVKKAYAVSGTPADCVKIALNALLPQRPDYVFSGINLGYNTAFDIAYSGTVAAAMEGRMNGIPAIAFSRGALCREVTDAYLFEVTRELLSKEAPSDGIWNVNFPGCPLSQCQGILWDTSVAKTFLFADTYEAISKEGSTITLRQKGMALAHKAPPGTDVYALDHGCVSVGKVRSMVL